MKGALASLGVERERDLLAAAGRADTGEALQRLEAACVRVGIKRTRWSAALAEEASRAGLEELTDGAIRNRKRMASLRQERPQLIAEELLRLSPSRQEVAATLTPDRLDEFIRGGVPTARGSAPLGKVRVKDLRRAARVARATPAGEPVTEEAVTCPAEAKRHPLDIILTRLKRLGQLTLGQAEEVVAMVVTLLALSPRETERTTRRLMDLVAQQDGPEAMDDVLDTLDGLAGRWKEVKFPSGAAGEEIRRQACAKVARILRTVSQWTGRTEREAG